MRQNRRALVGTPIEPSDLWSAFDNAPIGVAVVSPTGVLTGCNRALGRLLLRAPEHLVGTTLFDVTHPDDLPGAYLNCHRMQAGQDLVLRYECRFLRADGAVIWVLVSASHVPAVPGREAHLIMHIEDISEHKALEAELRHRAQHDALTSLPNRELLMDRIDQALARGHSTLRPTCLFFLDLDGFKGVNDTYGHAAGDAVLQQLAARLTALLRPGDTAARVGGDEFVILCENVDLQQAALIAERLRDAAREPFALSDDAVLSDDTPRTVKSARPNHSVSSDDDASSDAGSVLQNSVTLTAAVGVSSSHTSAKGFVQRPLSTAALLRRADLSMYDVKHGREESPPTTSGSLPALS